MNSGEMQGLKERVNGDREDTSDRFSSDEHRNPPMEGEPLPWQLYLRMFQLFHLPSLILSSASLQKTGTLAKLIFKWIDEVRCGIMALCLNLRWDAFKETPPSESGTIRGERSKPQRLYFCSHLVKEWCGCITGQPWVCGCQLFTINVVFQAGY